MDGWMDNMKTVYPTTNRVCGGGYKYVLDSIMTLYASKQAGHTFCFMHDFTVLNNSDVIRQNNFDISTISRLTENYVSPL